MIYQSVFAATISITNSFTKEFVDKDWVSRVTRLLATAKAKGLTLDRERWRERLAMANKFVWPLSKDGLVLGLPRKNLVVASRINRVLLERSSPMSSVKASSFLVQIVAEQFFGFAGIVVAMSGAIACSADAPSIEVDVVTVAAAEVVDSVANVPIRLSVVPAGEGHTKIRRLVVRMRPRSVQYDSSLNENNGIADDLSEEGAGGAKFDGPVSSRLGLSGPGFGNVLDYSPRTQTAALEDQPVLVRTTDERNDAAGVSIDGVYSSIATVHGGLDRTDKTSRMIESKRLPTMVASISSGTIDRGAGVLFKLDATPQLVVEGERLFEMRTAVGHQWRGGLIDVEIDLHTTETDGRNGGTFWDKTFESNRNDAENISDVIHHHFVVAVYRQGDLAAANDAHRLADSELNLRLASQRVQKKRTRSWRDRLINPLDLGRQDNSADLSRHWVSGVIAGRSDPYRDQRIRSLPMTCRTAAIDYADCRDRLIYGDTDVTATALASWVKQKGQLSPQ